MKKLKTSQQIFAIIVLALILLTSQLSYAQFQNQPNAPDFNLTDLDGNNHNLYQLLDAGFTVILLYGAEDDCWQAESMFGAMTPMWEEYGPRGDNSIRMFFVDNEPHPTEDELEDWISYGSPSNPPFATDELVSAYTSMYNISFPVVNYDGNILGYEVNGGPSYFIICPNRYYHFYVGYGEFTTLPALIAHKDVCEGADLSNDVALSGFKSIPQFCKKEGQTTFSFAPMVYSNTSVFYNGDEIDGIITEDYEIKSFVNNNLIQTQDVDPLDDGELTSVDFVFIDPPLTVSVGDSVRFELIYPDDSFAENNTLEYSIPNNIPNSPTATTNELSLAFNMNENALPTPEGYIPAHNFSIQDSDDYFIYENISNEDSGEDEIYTFNLENGQCYKIRFVNQHSYAPVLKDSNNVTIISIAEFAFFPSIISPWIYFNVNSKGHSDNTSGVEEQNLYNNIEKVEYFSLLGKLQSVKSYSELSEGIFIEVKHFKNKVIQSQKVIKLKN